MTDTKPTMRDTALHDDKDDHATGHTRDYGVDVEIGFDTYAQEKRKRKYQNECMGVVCMLFLSSFVIGLAITALVTHGPTATTILLPPFPKHQGCADIVFLDVEATLWCDGDACPSARELSDFVNDKLYDTHPSNHEVMFDSVESDAGLHATALIWKTEDGPDNGGFRTSRIRNPPREDYVGQ
jgi:hypothetical protein